MPTLRIRGVALILFFLLQPPMTYTVEEAEPLPANSSPSIKQFLNSATDLKVINRCSADAAKQLRKVRRCIAPIVGPYGMGDLQGERGKSNSGSWRPIHASCCSLRESRSQRGLDRYRGHIAPRFRCNAVGQCVRLLLNCRCSTNSCANTPV